MNYLDPGPMIFGPIASRQKTKQVTERGGPAAPIAKEDRCISGRHNKRLTECYCAMMKKKK
ncbi:MAG TPA: hypothetical protein VLT57_19955 [Bryobacteraceae bacterium]|nr:hypothetical protein [Bryobacteraceae bacterium]